MRRGIAATALVASLVLTATACGSDSDTGTGDKTAGGELSGTVTWWDTSNESEKATFEKIAEGFEKKHPEVDVKYVSVPFDQALNNFKNAAGSNSGAPDVLRTEVAWVADIANLGYLAPLDGTPAMDNEDDYLPQAMASTKFNGKTYGAPQVIDSMGLFYNKEIFKKAGVEAPKTLDELKTVAAKIKDKTGKTGMYLRGDDAYYYLSFLYGEGGDLLDVEKKEVTIDDEAGVKAFAAARDLVESGAAITDATNGWDNMTQAFNTGDVAMIINGPWGVSDAKGGEAMDGGKNLGIAPIPAGSAGQGAPQGGHNYSVYAGSKNIEASYEFVKYMSSAAVQQQVTEEINLLPTRTSVYEQPSVAGNEFVKFFKPSVDVAVERPWIPEGQSLFKPILDQYTGVLTGDITPEKAAESVGGEYSTLLKDWK